ncbi:MAG: hypothetical protein HY925_08740, partial [Elusimicrobia bacterium]|nr:hypothetical protein [Elusimicrobiota bacterium]
MVIEALVTAVFLVQSTGWAAGAYPGYAWDPGSRESVADARGLAARGAVFHADEADEAVRRYVQSEASFEELFPVPVTEEKARERGLVLTGVLQGIRSDFVSSGEGEAFSSGLRELLEFYDGAATPESWKDPDRAAVDRQAGIFAFALCAYLRKDLTSTFDTLRWPLPENIRSSVRALARQGWDSETRDAMLALLLKEGSPGGAAAAGRVASVKPPAAPTTRSKRGAQIAAVDPVATTPRSIERGLARPAAPAAPPKSTGWFDGALDWGRGVLDTVGNAAAASWEAAQQAALGARMMLPWRPNDMPQLVCKYLVVDCQTQWRDGEQPEPSNRRGCEFLLFGCEDGLDPKAKYVKIAGDLYVKGPRDAADIHPNDVKQGAIGDCYYMSSIASVAQQRPELIREMIHDDGKGRYTVTYHRWDGDAPAAVKVTVDNTFPSRAAGPLYAHDGDTELWPMILEKAYAKFHDNSYVQIGYGGWPDEALRELSGKPSSRTDARSTSLKSIA